MLTAANLLSPPPTDTALREYTSAQEVDSVESTICPGRPGKLELPRGTGTIVYDPHFLAPAAADELLSATRDAQSFARTPIEFDNAKHFIQPRDTAFFGTRVYSYGGERRTPTAWHADPPASTALERLGRELERRLELPHEWFNLVLVNRYRGGNDFMEWHADNERNLGDEPVIASVSVGAVRAFHVRPAFRGSRGLPVQKLEYSLQHGSLLVMRGRMQHYYQHAVPRLEDCEGDIGVRINLTFRRVLQEDEGAAFPYLPIPGEEDDPPQSGEPKFDQSAQLV